MPKWDIYLNEIDEDNERVTEKFEKFGKKKVGKVDVVEKDDIEVKQKEKRVDKIRKGE